VFSVHLVRRDVPETCHKVLACQRGASAGTWGLAHLPPHNTDLVDAGVAEIADQADLDGSSARATVTSAPGSKPKQN